MSKPQQLQSDLQQQRQQSFEGLIELLKLNTQDAMSRIDRLRQALQERAR